MIKYKGVDITALKYKGVDIPSAVFKSQELLDKYIGMIDAGAVAIWDFTIGAQGSLSTVVDDKANKVGKNLINKVTMTSGWITTDTGLFTSNGDNGVSEYIKVNSNTYYTLSKGAYCFLYDENKNFISFLGNDITTFLTTNNTSYVRIQTSASYAGAVIFFSDLQLELGSTATAYEPYQKNTALLKNFAGTTSSGNVSVPIISPKGTAKTFTNLLGNDGNMIDANSNNQADGWTYINTTAVSCVGNEVVTLPTASGNRILRNLSYQANDILYACAYVKATKTTSRLLLRDDAGSNIVEKAHSGSGLYEFLSFEYTVTPTQTTLSARIDDSASSSWTNITTKQCHVFTKNTIFPDPLNRPTKNQMDVIVQQAVARYGYINSRVLLIEWKNMLKADGTDDYAEVVNNGSLDFVGTQDFAFVLVFATPSTINTRYCFFKGLDGSTGMQYSMLAYNDGRLTIRLSDFSDITIAPIGSIIPNSLYAVVVKRISNVMKCYVNNVLVSNQVNTKSLPNSPFIRLFARSNNTSGTLHGGYSDLFYANLSAYGASVDETKLNAEYQKLLTEYGII